MDLPTSFDYLKNVGIVLRPSQGDATASYAVTKDGDDLGDIECYYAENGYAWVFNGDDTLYAAEMRDIAEALEALNALENGGRDE